MKWKSKFRLRRKRRVSVLSMTDTNNLSMDHQMSAAYVQDAIEGRYHKSGLGQNLLKNRNVAVWCVRITSHIAYTIFLLIVVGFHCGLSIVEPPQMISKRWSSLPPHAVYGGISCCIVYIVDIVLILFYCQPKEYFSFTYGKLYAFFIVLVTLDYIIFAACGRMIFRALRPLLLIFRIPSLRSTGLVMMGVTPKFVQFLLMMFGYVMLFAVIGVHIFMDLYIGNEVVQRQHEGIYEGAFNNTGIAILEVFVLMAGGSYPRFMIPAYEKYNAAVLPFFATIIISGEIVLYGILVAQIYDFYAKANKQHIKEERHYERQCLIKAFEILDEGNTGIIPFTQWKGLMRALKSKVTSSEILKRFRKLKDLAKNEQSKTNMFVGDVYLTLNLYEFFHLPDVLQFTVEKSNVKRSFQSENERRISWLSYDALKIEKLRTLCRKWYYNKFTFYVSLSLNLLYLAPFALIWYEIPQVSSVVYFYTNAILMGLIVLEVLLQFIALGFTYMIQEMFLNNLMVVCAAICMLYVWITCWEKWNDGWISVAGYMCMVLRLSSYKRRSSSTFHWLRRIAPPFFTLFCLTLIAFYTYGVIGMEGFGYLAADLADHEVLPEGVSLCSYGFETLGCTLLTLFQISLGSSWHKVMHYIMQEISEWCCIYFVFFYAFMQMLLLNIISAIIVELANAILIDENEAKQRDREFETKDENRTIEKQSTNSSIDRFSYRTSSGNTSLISAVARTAGSVSLDCAFVLPTQQEYSLSSNQTMEGKRDQRISSKDSATYQRRPTLPCIAEENMVLEDLDEVTLTGRKELGKWTRDILPDMTFLSPSDLKRLHAEMSKSLANKKSNQRKRPHGSTSIGIKAN